MSAIHVNYKHGDQLAICRSIFNSGSGKPSKAYFFSTIWKWMVNDHKNKSSAHSFAAAHFSGGNTNQIRDWVGSCGQYLWLVNSLFGRTQTPKQAHNKAVKKKNNVFDIQRKVFGQTRAWQIAVQNLNKAFSAFNQYL